MSVALLEKTVAYLRSQFTKKEVLDVVQYGGEFSGGELGKVSYACPTIFVTGLGWTPGASGSRLAGRKARAVHMGAFIVFKHVDRPARLRGAMALAEKVCLALSEWNPGLPDEPYTVAPLEADPQAENLYGRAIDAAGQALWLVKWTQDVKPNATQQELMDLLSIEIIENCLPGVLPAAPAPGEAVLTVTDQVNFQQLP